MLILFFILAPCPLLTRVFISDWPAPTPAVLADARTLCARPPGGRMVSALTRAVVSYAPLTATPLTGYVSLGRGPER